MHEEPLKNCLFVFCLSTFNFLVLGALFKMVLEGFFKRSLDSLWFLVFYLEQIENHSVVVSFYTEP